MKPNRNVFDMFPSIDSVDRRFASLHRVLRDQFPLLQRYYQSATTSCRPSRRASSPSLGGTSDVHSLDSLLGGRVHRQGLELLTRYLRPGSRGGNDRTSQVPGEPRLSVCTCSKPTPAGLHAPDHYGVAAWPLVLQKQRLPRGVFRRSIAWLSDSLPTLCRMRYHIRHKTRFQLPVRLYWTGFPPARFR